MLTAFITRNNKKGSFLPHFPWNYSLKEIQHTRCSTFIARKQSFCLATFRDVQFGNVSKYTSLQVHTQSTPLLHLCYFCPDWPHLALLLYKNPGPYRLHNSPSQKVSLYFLFSLVLLSVNTSTLTGVAISISLIEE